MVNLERPLVRFGVYALVALIAFVVALRLTFPDEELREIATVNAEKQLGNDYRVTISDLDLWWVTGVSLYDVTLEENVSDAEPEFDEELPEVVPTKIRIPEVSVRLALLSSLFKLAPVLQYKVDLGGGTLRGKATLGQSHQITVETSELDLRKTPALLAYTGVPFFGTLDADISVTLDGKTMVPTEGSFKLAGKQLTLGPATVRTDKFPPITFLEIPQTNFGNLNIDMKIESGEKPRGSKLDINEFVTRGRDARSEAWGHIDMSTRLDRHRPKVEFRLQFDEGFVKKNSLGPLLNVKQFREGQNQDWYGFTLFGTLGKLQFKGSSQAATGPRDRADDTPNPDVDDE